MEAPFDTKDQFRALEAIVKNQDNTISLPSHYSTRRLSTSMIDLSTDVIEYSFPRRSQHNESKIDPERKIYEDTSGVDNKLLNDVCDEISLKDILLKETTTKSRPIRDANGM